MKSFLLLRRLLLPAALFCFLLAAPLAHAGTAFSKLVVFGDSFNDHGNMAQFTGGAFPNTPQYVYGRQSNGPVWVEYLASRLGMSDKIANYAVIGAMTRPAPGFPTGNVWSPDIPGLEGTDVATQVQDYLGDANGTADSAALHILEGGANDFPRVANPAMIVQNLVGSFLALQHAGAKHIMVVNLPDIGRTPRVILAERFGLVPPGYGAFLSSVCAQLNQALAATIASVTAPDVTVTIANLHGFMNTVAANPSGFGLVDTQLPYLMFGAGGDPATWLFWDDLHPTTRGHQIFAEDTIASLLQTYSPRQGHGNGQGVVNALRGLVK